MSSFLLDEEDKQHGIHGMYKCNNDFITGYVVCS